MFTFEAFNHLYCRRASTIYHIRAGALLAPHPDSGRQDLQLASLETYHHVLETTPESGVKVRFALSKPTLLSLLTSLFSLTTNLATESPHNRILR
jgi:hypothetical protein